MTSEGRPPCQGPYVFNHFAKERPVTSNQTYGYEVIKNLKESEEQRKVDLEKCRALIAQNNQASAPIIVSKHAKSVQKEKVKYFVAEPLVKNEESSDQSCATMPSQRLKDVKGIYLWNSISGVLCRPEV